MGMPARLLHPSHRLQLQNPGLMPFRVTAKVMSGIELPDADGAKVSQKTQR